MQSSIDGLKEQMVISTSAASEEVASRGKKDYGKKWPPYAQVSQTQVLWLSLVLAVHSSLLVPQTSLPKNAATFSALSLALG